MNKGRRHRTEWNSYREDDQGQSARYQFQTMHQNLSKLQGMLIDLVFNRVCILNIQFIGILEI